MSRLGNKLPRIAFVEQLSEKYALLSSNDRRALTVLLAFLLASLLYGVFMFHQHASKVEQRALQKKNDLFWLRSQAPYIKQNTGQSNEGVQSKIETLARRYNLNVNVVENGDVAQLSVTHPNAAVLGNFLVALASDQLIYDRLSIQQEKNMEIQAEATLRAAL